MPDELNPLPLLALCHNQLKTVAVPAWNRESQQYRFCRWTPDAPLESGPKKITQPIEKLWMTLADLDLVLVPGLAFGRHGERLGFGAGIYDRLLSSKDSHAHFIGMAYDWQLLDSLPQDPHDIRMHAILTPTQFLIPNS